jgi:hypothetical protein
MHAQGSIRKSDHHIGHGSSTILHAFYVGSRENIRRAARGASCGLSLPVPEHRTTTITAACSAALTLADGIAYVEAALAAGLDVDELAPWLSFFLDVHNNFTEEIAKFRATRSLWANIMRERFGGGRVQAGSAHESAAWLGGWLASSGLEDVRLGSRARRVHLNASLHRGMGDNGTSR